MEDKILFEQAYSSHGKSFKRIQQIVSVNAMWSCMYNCEFFSVVCNSGNLAFIGTWISLPWFVLW